MQDDNEQEPGTELLDRLVEQVGAEPEAEKQPAIDPNDLDAVEEAAALKALADEDAKVAAGVQPAKEEPVKGADGSKTEAAEQPAAREQTITIPKPRFDQVAKERDDARAAVAYWKGRADQAAAAPAAPADKTPAAPTPEQQLKEIDQQREAVDAKVDAGELTYAQARKQERELDRQEEVIRIATRAPTRQEPRPSSELYLDAKTEELEAAHPYVPLLDGDDLAFLTRKAVASLAAEKIVLPKGDLAPRDQLVLRTRIAELSDQFGPALTGKTLAPRPNPAAKPGLTPQGKNLRAKLQDAQDAPPDLTAAGRGGAPMEYTDAQINAMSQDELDALPVSTLEKILNRQPT